MRESSLFGKVTELLATCLIRLMVRTPAFQVGNDGFNSRMRLHIYPSSSEAEQRVYIAKVGISKFPLDTKHAALDESYFELSLQNSLSSILFSCLLCRFGISAVPGIANPKNPVQLWNPTPVFLNAGGMNATDLGGLWVRYCKIRFVSDF